MYTIQQETLLFTNSSFSQKQWCKKEITEGNKQLLQKKRLELACWNGLLSELLQEIMEQPGFDQPSICQLSTSRQFGTWQRRAE